MGDVFVGHDLITREQYSRGVERVDRDTCRKDPRDGDGGRQCDWKKFREVGVLETWTREVDTSRMEVQIRVYGENVPF